MHTRFDRSTAYALCAMNFLVHQGSRGQHPSTARQIAEACHLPEGILRKSMLGLSRAGLVRGTQGRGYTLSLRGEAASVLDVVEAIQGQRSFAAEGCFIHDGPCPKGSACRAREVFQEMQSMVCGRLEALAVSTLPVDTEGAPPVCFQ